MSEAARILEAEMVIPCPVCKKPLVFVEGEININRQLSFFCSSKKCRGNRRYIKKEDLQKIVDNFNKVSV
jgi:uncharacterized protein YbaR (Trm112 family)